MARCFISINLPKNVGEEIGKIQESLPEFNGKNTEIRNMHLTLKFLGEIDSEKISNVSKNLRNVKFSEIKAKIDSIGVFSEKHIRIVWLHMKGVEKLQKSIDESLEGIFEKEKRFMSHITIARVKKVKDGRKFLDKIREIEIPEISFNVNEFCLMSSNLKEKGPEYKVMEKFNCNEKI